MIETSPMSAERFTLDTNLLVYAFDKDAGKRHTMAQKVLAQTHKLDCVLTLQSLCEFFNTVTRKEKMPLDHAFDHILDLQELFPTVHAKPSTLSRAIKMVSLHKLSFWDAMLWATARDSGVSVILSEDFQHNCLLDGVTIINPLKKNPILSVA